MYLNVQSLNIMAKLQGINHCYSVCTLLPPCALVPLGLPLSSSEILDICRLHHMHSPASMMQKGK